MLVLGSILAPSMLHTAFPAFPVVVPPSESRRMISTWHSHNCVFRQILLTFLNSDIMCDKSQERWVILDYWLLPSDQWMQSYELFRETFLPSLPPLHFHFQFALLEFFALLE
jgi:hypothetical protein